jgi:membrane-associated phospholipid phosphatase
MKSAAITLLAVLLIFSPAMALEGSPVVVDEEPQVAVPDRRAPFIEEDSTPPARKAALRLVQEDSDSPQAEPEQQPDPPQQDPEEQAQPEQDPDPQPEAPQPQEDQPEEPQQQQAPQDPVPVPMPPDTRRQSTPPVQHANAAPQLIAAAAVQVAPAAESSTPPVQSPAVKSAQAVSTDPEERPITPSAASADGQTQSEPPSNPTYLSEIKSDFRYTVNNAEADVEDVVTAPLHVGKLGGLVTQPAFYYTVIGAGAGLGGAFALDQTARAHLRHMGSGTADGFETGGNFFVYGGTGLLYLWGLQTADSNLREHEITGLESSGIASLITLGFKNAFGRLRPHQGHGHFAFFDGGDSFVSSAATPVFALAAAASEAYDNKWYVAIPAYLGATAVGVGRMGKDDHWLSDIVGSALIGVGTTELLLYMHHSHAMDTSRFRIFPVAAPNGGPGTRQTASNVAPQGLGVSYEW